jgi:hypothetical protein
MTQEKICSKIEQGLMNIEESKLISIFNKMFPEELLGPINSNDEFKEEVIQMIIDNVEDDEFAYTKLYKKIFNEKVIEEDYIE